MAKETPTETTPLLEKKDDVEKGQELTDDGFSFKLRDDDVKFDKQEHGITDNMMYRTEFLCTWEAFSTFYATIWASGELWMMMLKLLGVALIIAFFTFLFVPEPDQLKASRFTDLSKFLNVVVGLLLGFFLSSSMNRWYECVNGMLQLLDSIRNLQMQLAALGVPDTQSLMLLRYGFASSWLLYGQLLVDTVRLQMTGQEGCEETVREDRNEMWSLMVRKRFKMDRAGKTALLTQREAECLRMTRDPPGMMWMWVASLIGRLAQDGFIPPMASPTYGRIMNLAQNAHAGIREVKCAITIQAPFSYSHLLATLVHINNLLNAVTLGVVSGIAMSTYLSGHGYSPLFKRDIPRGKHIAQDWQMLCITFMYCFIGPVIYQALLLISMHLAQPFDSRYAYIPFDRLLGSLERDLTDGRDLLDETEWVKPAFKQPAPAK